MPTETEQNKITYQVAQMVLEELCDDMAKKSTNEINEFLNGVEDSNLRTYLEKQIITKLSEKKEK